MSIKNSAGRVVEENISGVSFSPFSGAKKNPWGSKITSLVDALKKCDLKNGDTVSFHHQLRFGDFVVNLTLEAIKELGVKDVRIAQTAIFDVHKPVIDHIQDGVISRIEGSLNGVVGDFISKNPLPFPVILRSHGGRWAAVKTDELHVNIAVIAASTADLRGNCTGIIGENAFGPISYSQIDAMCADHVIVVSDNIVDYPCPFQEITERYVDYVARVDHIGDPTKIAKGSLRITEDPMKLSIARACTDLMEAAGIIKDGMIFQSGAGGISLAAMKYLNDKLEEKNAVAAAATGGLTKFIVDIYRSGRVKQLYYSQVFDAESVKFVQENPTLPADIGHYADPTSKGRTADSIDTIVLGATEVDVGFNVNVNTHSDGRLLHGIGGHQDTAAGAYLTIISVPLFRKKNPVVRDSVTTITTPGDVVDAIVTDMGTAINPRRKDLLEKVRGKIDLKTIEELRDMAYAQTGEPDSPSLGDEIVGVTKWFDGTLLDIIRRVKV